MRPRRMMSCGSWAAAAAAVVVLVAGVGAPVAAMDWTGGTDANWDTPGNWSPAGPPANADDVVFPLSIPGTGSTITLTSGEYARSLDFNNSYTLTGGDLTFGGGGVTTVDPGYTTTIASQLKSDGVSNYLIKNGTGTLILTGDNTGYTKWADVSAGVLSIRAANAVPGSYIHVNASNRTAEVYGGITTPTSDHIYLSGSNPAGNGALRSGGGDNTWGGWVRLHGGGGTRDIGVEAGRTLTLTTGIETTNANAFTMEKLGDGTLVLNSGEVTDNWATLVSAGVVRVRHDNALGSAASTATVASGAALEMENNVTVAPTLLTLNGAGIGSTGALRSLSGDNAWNGPVTVAGSTIGVDAGTLTIGGAIGGSGGFTKAGDGTLILSGASNYSGNTTLSRGTLRLDGGNDRLPTGTAVIMGNGSTLDLNGQDQTLARIDNSSCYIVLGSGMLTIGNNNQVSDIRGNNVVISGTTGGLTKIGTNVSYLGGSTSYDGGTFVNAGRLALYRQSNCLPTTGDVTVVGGAVLDLNLYKDSGRVQTIDELSGTGTVWLNTATFVVGNNGGSSTFSGAITDGSGTGGGLTKVGGGTLTLAGNNTYGGATTIGDGTIAAGHANALGSAAGGTTVVSGATLDLNGQAVGAEAVTLNGTGVAGGGALTNTSAAAASLAGSVGLGSDASIVANAGTITLSGSVTTGAHQLTIAGSGDVTKTGAAFAISSGGELVKDGAGTLYYGGQQTVGDGALVTVNDGEFHVNDFRAGFGTLATVDLTGGTLRTNTYCIFGAAGKGVLNMSGGEIRSGGTLYSAWTGDGEINQSGGDVYTTRLHSATDGGNGDYNLSGGTLNVTNEIALGYSSGCHSEFVQSGGTASCGSLILGGQGSGGTANYTINENDGPAQLTVGPTGLVVAKNGTSVCNLNVDGGTVQVNGDFYVGGAVGTTGTVTQTGGSVTIDPSHALRFGSAGVAATGTYDLNGGSLTLANIFYSDPTKQQLNFGGGTLEANGALNTDMPMTLNAGGGTVDTAGHTVTLGGVLDGAGSFTKVGAGTLVLGGANSYTGITYIKDGTIQLAGDDRINPDTEVRFTPYYAPATLDLNGHDQTLRGMNYSGGTVDLGGGTLTLGNSNGGSDIRDWRATPDTLITGDGSLRKIGTNIVHLGGPTDYTGGTFIEGGTLGLYVHNNNLPSTGDVTIYPGARLSLVSSSLYGGATHAQQTIGRLMGSGAVSITRSGGYSAEFVVGNGGGTSQFDGVIQDGVGTVSLTKVGAGTLTLTGANVFSGPTHVNEGTLLVNNTSGSGTGTGDVTVSGGVLGGTGAISGAVTVNAAAHLAPGLSPGILTTGVLTLESGAEFDVELLGTMVGDDYDQLNVLGTVGLDDSILNATLGYPAAYGDSFTIINNDGTDPVDGEFRGLPEKANFYLPYGGNDYMFHITYRGGQDFNDVVLTSVPEPATLTLLGLGALGLLARRRRK